MLSGATRYVAAGALLAICAACGFAELIRSIPFDWQSRETVETPPTWTYPLGTDDLGRDRLVRLLWGTRLSLGMAAVAAILATSLAAVLGGLAGASRRAVDRLVSSCIDLLISVPWIFLFLTVRALLPLEAPPMSSVLATFVLMAATGWAASARVVRACVRSAVNSEYMLQAAAAGVGSRRRFFFHLLPNMREVLRAQFWILLPSFIIGEAGLGLLGLGVPEPLPSLGNSLRELERVNPIEQPWIAAPAALLLMVLMALQTATHRKEI